MSAFKTKKITHSWKSFSSKRKNDNTLEENDKTIEQKTSLPVSSKRSIKTRIIGWLLIISSILFIGILWLRAVGNVQLSSNDDFRIFQPTKVAFEKPKTTQNILIAGIGWLGHPGWELTDSIMLVKADSKTQTVTMLSIPRDLYVAYGKNSAGKINSLYPLGKSSWSGINLLAQKITDMTGEPVDHFLVIDFSGFKSIVDALGGVTVDVPKDIYDNEYPNENWWWEIFSLKKWIQEMDGNIALKFARSRHSSSDFDRSERQQILLKAIKDKALSLGVLTNPTKVSDLINSVRNNINTDLTVGDIVDLGISFKDIKNSDIHMYSLNDACSEWSCQAGGYLYQPSMAYFWWAWALIPEWASVSRLSSYDEIIQYVKLIFTHPELQDQQKSISIITTKNNLAKAQMIRKKLSQLGFPLDYSSVIIQTGSITGNTRIVSYWNDVAQIGINETSPLIEALKMIEPNVAYHFQGNNEYITDQGPRIEIILSDDSKEYFTFAKEESHLPALETKTPSQTDISVETTPQKEKEVTQKTSSSLSPETQEKTPSEGTGTKNPKNNPLPSSKKEESAPQESINTQTESYQFQPGEWENFNNQDTVTQ